MALRTISTEVLASNLVRSFFLYHFMVGRLRHICSAICSLVNPSDTSFRIACSFAVRTFSIMQRSQFDKPKTLSQRIE